jgi:hypothetical protein
LSLRKSEQQQILVLPCAFLGSLAIEDLICVHGAQGAKVSKVIVTVAGFFVVKNPNEPFFATVFGESV